MVMIQEPDKEYLSKPFFYDCIWNDNEIVYPLANYNALCKTDILTGKTTIIGQAEEKNESLLYVGGYKWNDYIIFSSYKARAALAFYNIKRDEWSYIPVEKEKKNWLNFREENVFEYGGFLYIFPYAFVVLKVDVQKRNIEYLFYPNLNPSDDIRGELAKIDYKIYIPMRHKNIIYKFNLETEQIDTITVNTKLEGIDTLCFDGKLFWMTGIGKMICSWDETENICVSYDNYPESFGKFTEREEEKGWWFALSKVYHNAIYFIPSYANMLIKLDTKTLEMKEIAIKDEEEDRESLNRKGRFYIAKYGLGKQQNNRLMLLSTKNKNLVLVDLNTEKVKKTEFQMEHNIENYILKNINEILDDGMVSVSHWLENMCISQILKKMQESEVVGKLIMYQIL